MHAKGEELLLAAVSRGEMPIHVALEIATAKDEDVKRSIAEAYERGDLRGRAVSRARVIVEQGFANGKRYSKSGWKQGTGRKVSADDLVRSYKRAAQKQAVLVKKARACSSMLRIVCSALRELGADEHFVTLLRAEGLEKMPKYLAEQLKKRGGQ